MPELVDRRRGLRGVARVRRLLQRGADAADLVEPVAGAGALDVVADDAKRLPVAAGERGVQPRDVGAAVVEVTGREVAQRLVQGEADRALLSRSPAPSGARAARPRGPAWPSGRAWSGGRCSRRRGSA